MPVEARSMLRQAGAAQSSIATAEALQKKHAFAPKAALVAFRHLRQNADRSTYRISATSNVQERETTATTTTTIALASDEDLKQQRRFLSILPPFFRRETIMQTVEGREGLWTFVQPLRPPGQADIRLRMVAARLPDNTLALIGPIAPTQELINMINNLDYPVSHIIIPNTSPEHFLFAPALASVFPTTTLWTVPGFWEGAGVPLPGRSLLFSSVRERNPCRTLGVDELPAGIEAAVLSVPFFVEAAIYLTGQRALLMADTGLSLSASDPEYSNLPARGADVARKLGVYDRLGPVTRIVFERYSDAGIAWVEQVLKRWGKDMEVVVPAHGSAPVGDAATAFRECFDFLKIDAEAEAVVAQAIVGAVTVGATTRR